MAGFSWQGSYGKSPLRRGGAVSRRGHANLLCIVPILADDLFRGSERQGGKCIKTAQGLAAPSLWARAKRGGWAVRPPPRVQRIGNMAEWLRRQTRNLVGIALVGSNPAVVELTFLSPVDIMFCRAVLAHAQKLTARCLTRRGRCGSFVLRRGQFRSY